MHVLHVRMYLQAAEYRRVRDHAAEKAEGKAPRMVSDPFPSPPLGWEARSAHQCGRSPSACLAFLASRVSSIACVSRSISLT
jgi:hypothetical protein